MVIAVPKILDIINSSKASVANSSIRFVKDAIRTQTTTASMLGVSFEKTGECYLFDFDDQESQTRKLCKNDPNKYKLRNNN